MTEERVDGKAANAPEESINNNMAKKKIMIVDDDKEFLDELRETLELSGYELISVNDPLQALDIFKSIKPAAILLDLKMPQKSGFQLANELRDFSEGGHIPIIAMSAFYKDEYAPLIKICGIKRCLTKPFNPLDVITEIEEALAEERKE